MDQAGRRLRFLLEPLHDRRIGQQLGTQDLDRDGAVQRGLLGQVDFRHPAAPQRTNDAEFSQSS